jgi:hypothetical protein
MILMDIFIHLSGPKAIGGFGDVIGNTFDLATNLTNLTDDFIPIKSGHG